MSLAPSYPYYLANAPESPNQDLEVLDKYSGEVATRVALADDAAIDRGIQAAVDATEACAAMAAYERQAVLDHCVARFEERFEELAVALCIEAGKPIKDARGEVGRLIDTFRIASEESVRIGGEVMPLDIAPRARGYSGAWKRVPIGPVLVHLVRSTSRSISRPTRSRPRSQSAVPFVLKPASLTPIGALVIGEVLAETDLPKGAFSILPCSPRRCRVGSPTDERLKLL